MRGRLTAGVLMAALTVGGCGGEPPVSPLPTEAAASTGVGASPTAPPPTSRSPAASPRRTTATRATPTRTRTRTSTPTLPPSCRGAVVYPIDVTNDELALIPSLCLAVGAVLRIEHIGPGEVSTDAPELVDGRYEAGVVELRCVRPGTVVVTIPQNGREHRITVVIR